MCMILASAKLLWPDIKVYRSIRLVALVINGVLLRLGCLVYCSFCLLWRGVVVKRALLQGSRFTHINDSSAEDMKTGQREEEMLLDIRFPGNSVARS